MMNIHNGYLVMGLLALALSGSAMAHDPGHHATYPDGAWSGSATVWGHAQGFSGWSGTLRFGAVYAYPTAYAPVVPMAAVHHHLESCRHAPPRHHARAMAKHFKHGRSHAQRRVEHYPGHH